ncbi:MLO-like protein 3 isoform X2 [Diospyros lotus]|uniref:MLO-like protein 3 isoform X2 n=1 Tax=Diospyros lotus TaxID=55363 RepID=UPI00224CF7CF|nr:MLO-like protein 3 isoform X2 [Diospyros lotus]
MAESYQVKTKRQRNKPVETFTGAVQLQWLKKHRKNGLFEAVEKLKSVLMLLGFMSLLLTATQRPISRICVTKGVANSMLPCRKSIQTKTTKHLADVFPPERVLAAYSSSSDDHCAEDKTSLISAEGVNQLSVFLFVLAVMQIVYSVITMALGRAKMRRWKCWEQETQTIEYQTANDPNRFRITRETTFGRRHMSSCATTPLRLWIKCFFRQFFHSVAKVDYFTLRRGFIAAHLSTKNTFNFQKYIQRSLEEDFKLVVGISPIMWLVVVIFMVVDVHGWHVYLWISFLPLITVLVLGTKLQVVVARMALRLQNHNSVIRGSPLVQPNDSLFWFSQPQFVLTLLHYVLFMNAFELAFFVWVTVEFGFHSCYHERIVIIVIRVVLAVTVQVLCSYITLPLYALVTQMGTHFKASVLEEQTAGVIRQWHAQVREKRKKGTSPSSHSTPLWREDSGSVPSITGIANSPDLSSFLRRSLTPSHHIMENDHPEIVPDYYDNDDDRIQPSQAPASSSSDEVELEVELSERRTKTAASSDQRHTENVV